ncbi:unnamed protein product [Urochloa decumbens]|uniref:Uncharacterized protein n=1 Tax=Urochloa decumbens TaxID=240449 RepID=A0ABC8WA31_9POAL
MKLPLTMSTATALMLTVAVVLILTFVLRPHRRRRKPLNLPPGPRGWPVFGSLGLLTGALPPHRVLAALAARHGELMHLRLGSFDVVVASSAEAARLVLKTHDLAFAGRPAAAWGVILSYGYRGIVQTPYGAYWRMARKLCATELFSPRRVDAFEHVRVQETRAMARRLFETAGAAVHVKEHLMGFTTRNILRMVLGDKWSPGSNSAAAGGGGGGEGEELWRLLGEAFAVSGLPPADEAGHVLLDRFKERVLCEHEEDRRRRRRAGDGELAARDLVDVLLQVAEDGHEEPAETRLTRDGIKAIIQDIFAGGTETAALTMEWAMAELLRRPAAMSAAAAELDRVVGRDRWAAESDLPGLTYIEAVVKETMRLHPVGPLLVPHCAREAVVAGGGGYDIPRGRACWFLAGGAAEGVDARGAHFQLVPFGSGRRMCPAYGLAMEEVAAALANLVHGFSWRLPDGVKPEDVSMEESFGLSMCMKRPLVAVAEPRLPAHLYTTPRSSTSRSG